jgi:hypothetical protein
MFIRLLQSHLTTMDKGKQQPEKKDASVPHPLKGMNDRVGGDDLLRPMDEPPVIHFAFNDGARDDLRARIRYMTHEIHRLQLRVKPYPLILMPGESDKVRAQRSLAYSTYCKEWAARHKTPVYIQAQESRGIIIARYQRCVDGLSAELALTP